MAPLNYDGQTLDSLVGKSIFDYADALSVRVPTSCGRTGECHECIVEIKRGMEALSPLTDAEAFLREDYRLACQAVIVDANADVEFAAGNRVYHLCPASTSRSLDGLHRPCDSLEVPESDRGPLVGSPCSG